MEYIIGLLVALIGAVFFFKNKADKAKLDALLSETRGRDKELQEQQKDVENAIDEIDAGIKKLKQDRKKERDARAKKSREERAEEWND